MKRISLAATILVAAVGQVWAADLPAPAPPPAQAPAAYIPAPSPVYNWGGVYFGINGGYGFGSSKWTTTPGATTGTFNTSGFLVGGTIGANVQFDAFVLGLEGDFDGSWLDGTSSTCTPATC